MTEQDEKITEWLSWGMHNGVCPELIVVAALALGAAQKKTTSDEWYEKLKRDEEAYNERAARVAKAQAMINAANARSERKLLNKYVPTAQGEGEAISMDCAQGIHSWAGETGKQPSDLHCVYCGEMYGNPD